MSQTWTSHEICTWLSVAVLGYGAIVLAAQMFLLDKCGRPPGGKARLPVDPHTLAGRMYYVCDSRMLWDFERLSMLGSKHRDERVARMGRGYRFGVIRGLSSGESRVGIDYAAEFEPGEQGIELGVVPKPEKEGLHGGRRLPLQAKGQPVV
jgi:hypothetical protein